MGKNTKRKRAERKGAQCETSVGTCRRGPSGAWVATTGASGTGHSTISRARARDTSSNAAEALRVDGRRSRQGAIGAARRRLIPAAAQAADAEAPDPAGLDAEDVHLEVPPRGASVIQRDGTRIQSRLQQDRDIFKRSVSIPL